MTRWLALVPMLLIVGCGETPSPSPDLAVPGDLGSADAGADLRIASSTDLSIRDRARVGLIDVAGTLYQGVGDGGETAHPATHVLDAVAGFPSSGGRTPDFSNFNFSLGQIS